MLGFGRPSLWYSFSFPLLELTYATYSKHEKKFEELKIEQQHSIESYGHANEISTKLKGEKWFLLTT